MKKIMFFASLIITTATFAQVQPLEAKSWFAANKASLDAFPANLNLGDEIPGTGYILDCPVSVEMDGGEIIHCPLSTPYVKTYMTVCIKIGDALATIPALYNGSHDPEVWKAKYITNHKQGVKIPDGKGGYEYIYTKALPVPVTLSVVEANGRPLIQYTMQ